MRHLAIDLGLDHDEIKVVGSLVNGHEELFNITEINGKEVPAGVLYVNSKYTKLLGNENVPDGPILAERSYGFKECEVSLDSFKNCSSVRVFKVVEDSIATVFERYYFDEKDQLQVVDLLEKTNRIRSDEMIDDLVWNLKSIGKE